MAKTSVSQIKKIKEVYTKNVKGFYKHQKNILEELKTEIKNEQTAEIRSNIEREIKEKCKNVSISDIAWGHRPGCYVTFSVINTTNKVKKIFEESGIAKNDSYDYIVDSAPYIKVIFDHKPFSSDEYNHICKCIEVNCAEYKKKMKELDNWELDALKIAHTGELPVFEIEAAEPETCIV